MLSAFKTLGGLLGGRDYSRLWERAQRLKKAEGSEVAFTCLENALRGTEDEVHREDDNYAPCRILMAECQVESGLRHGDMAGVLAGMDLLLRVESVFGSYLMLRSRTWPDVLEMLERSLECALAPDWCPSAEKDPLRRIVLGVVTAWCNLQEPSRALRLGALGLLSFPADARLLIAMAEAAAAVGEPARCLEFARASLAAQPVPGSPAAAIALLESVERSGDPTQAHAALALKGEVFRRVGRWEQGYEALAQAESRAPGGLPEPAVEGLLLAALRKRHFAEVEQIGARYAPAGFGLERMATVEAALRDALEGFPDRRLLWLLWTQLNLHLGRVDAAIQGVGRILASDPERPDAVLEACRSVRSPASTSAPFRIALSRLLLRKDAIDLGLESLDDIESSGASPDELRAAIGICREVLARVPLHRNARAQLIQLLTRQGALDEALADSRVVLEQTGDAETVAALSWHVGGVAHDAGNSAMILAARELEIDAWIQANHAREALEALEVLGDHPIATPASIETAIARLRRLASHPACASRARLVIARFLRRLRRTEEAAAELLAIVETPTSPPGVLEAACATLQEMLDSVPDRSRALHALASRWLELGHIVDARAPLLEWLTTHSPDNSRLLDTLRSQLAAYPASDEWLELGVTALVAAGDEPCLVEATDWLRRWLELHPGDPAILDLCHRVAKTSTTDETRRTATTLGARAAILAGDETGLADLCQWVIEISPPWWQPIAEALEKTSVAVAVAHAGKLRDALTPPTPPPTPPPTATPALKSVSPTYPPAATSIPQPTPPRFSPAKPTEVTTAPGDASHQPPPKRPSSHSARVRAALAGAVVEVNAEPQAAAPIPSEASMPTPPTATTPGPVVPKEPAQLLEPNPPLLHNPLPSPTARPTQPRDSNLHDPPTSPSLQPIRDEARPQVAPTPVPEPNSVRRASRSQQAREALRDSRIDFEVAPPPTVSVPASETAKPAPAPQPPAALRHSAAVKPPPPSKAGEDEPAAIRRPSRTETLRHEVIDFDHTHLSQFMVEAPNDTDAATSANTTPTPSPSTAARGSNRSEQERQFSELVENAFDASRRKDYAQARQLFERASRIHPDDPRVRYNLNLLAKRSP